MSLLAGRWWYSKRWPIEGGYASPRYWRNWMNFAIDINTEKFRLALGPAWLIIGDANAW